MHDICTLLGRQHGSYQSVHYVSATSVLRQCYYKTQSHAELHLNILLCCNDATLSTGRENTLFDISVQFMPHWPRVISKQ